MIRILVAGTSGGPVHLDAAADAARQAITRGRPGIYNIAEEDGTVSCRRAAAELGWGPDFHIEEDNRWQALPA
jgi:hypothetical protein